MKVFVGIDVAFSHEHPFQIRDDLMPVMGGTEKQLILLVALLSVQAEFETCLVYPHDNDLYVRRVSNGCAEAAVRVEGYK
ncbi:hypothetical protein [Cyanobium sp. HWJ4-Hawea]|uniref:hypothetical protein n=1 Tax=Cyanobium sp. HWJ4-Hawea TaxID=2823713 RepID=UPI0020CF8457|nr:hypothetical protein [Cyanobium sp. HWJ4-Hawea]